MVQSVQYKRYNLYYFLNKLFNCIIFSILFLSFTSWACSEAIGHFCTIKSLTETLSCLTICNVPGSATCRLTPPSAAAWRPSCSSSRRRAAWPSPAAWRCCRTRRSASSRTTSGTDTSASPPGRCTLVLSTENISRCFFSFRFGRLLLVIPLLRMVKATLVETLFFRETVGETNIKNIILGNI